MAETRQNKTKKGFTLAELAAQFPSDAVLVNASAVRDPSFAGTLESGDIYYDPGTDTYYYVTFVSQYESRPNSAWVPLIR